MTDEELRPFVLEAIKTLKNADQYGTIQTFLNQKFVDEKLGPWGPPVQVQMSMGMQV